MVKSGKCDSLAGRAADCYSLTDGGYLGTVAIWWYPDTEYRLGRHRRLRVKPDLKERKQWVYLIMLDSIEKRLYMLHVYLYL